MCEVTEVHKETKLVSFRTLGGALTIISGKIRAIMGHVTPAERKKAFKTYHAIMDDEQQDLEKEKMDNYNDDIMTGLRGRE